MYVLIAVTISTILVILCVFLAFVQKIDKTKIKIDTKMDVKEVFEKYPDLKKYVQKIAHEMFSRKKLPRWVKVNLFFEDLYEEIFDSVVEAALLGLDEIEGIEHIMCQLVSDEMDLGASYGLSGSPSDFDTTIPEQVVTTILKMKELGELTD
jgi:hypothetical protein